ncbi:autotransporter domain-containing protein [Sorangium sp. So ce131]|uniref:autotransporter domain-containing protein n=1 Tax=Sorangium sp. So ce131 TaxID=3133282 RepID=UPI003F60099D
MAADIDGGAAVGEAAYWHSATFSVTARAGYEFGLGERYFLAPEVGLGYTIMKQEDGIADGASVLPTRPRVLRAIGGVRGGVYGGDGGRWIPSLFVRGGYASIFGEHNHAEAPWIEVGAAVDYALSRLIRVGAHASYESLWAQGYGGGAFTALQAGVALTFSFGGSERPDDDTVAAR